jgi:hypothetical protein
MGDQFHKRQIGERLLLAQSGHCQVPTTEVATNSITSSAGEQGLRNGEAEQLSSGKVDDEFKCFWCLDR